MLIFLLGTKYKDLKNIDVFPISPKSNFQSFMNDIKKCMQNPFDKSYLSTNTSEANEHYNQLRSAFNDYGKGLRRPRYFTCRGPFLENEFIKRFESKPLSYFSPFIPLFFPWFAAYKAKNDYEEFTTKIIAMLKPNYLYFVLSESDFGFIGRYQFSKRLPSNVFVFSASGMGHVAIPWIQCNQKPLPPQETEYFLSFCGNPRSCPIRKDILNLVRSVFGSDFYETRTDDWENVIGKSKFVLSPRGIAVSTYRTYEILRLEAIPVIYTDSIHWLPYYPKLNWSQFSILTNNHEFIRTATRIKFMSDDEYNQMKIKLNNVSNRFFQWDGFFDQVDSFFAGKEHYFTCSRAFLTRY